MASHDRQQPVVANGEPIGVNADADKKEFHQGTIDPLGDQKTSVLFCEAVALPDHAGAKLVDHAQAIGAALIALE
jgi:hypothetical protein